MITLLDEIQSLDIQKVNEVFLNIIFDKMTSNKKFKIIEKIKETTKLENLNAFKKIHVKRLLYAKSYVKNHSKRLKKQIKNLKGLETPICLLTPNFSQNYRNSELILHDKWLVLTMREIMSMSQMAKVADQFFDSLPEQDFNKLAYIISKKADSSIASSQHDAQFFGSQEHVDEATALKRAGVRVDGLLDFLNDMGSEAQEDSASFENTSLLSDFASFNFMDSIGVRSDLGQEDRKFDKKILFGL